ncbi:hypothetical protein [Novosphingobium sp.]|jgi:hypothetical protein|uniref:hypothetical protein n=1 Tax=Novosphingobium sp. TaxID=1874826 RepID=UPI002FE0C5CF
MTDPRKDTFDAVRAISPPGLFNDPGNILALNNLLDAFGAQRMPATDIPDDYWPMLSKIESGDRPYVKAASSSGSGLYQFLKATWIGEGGKWGSDMRLAFGGLRPTAEEQLARVKTFTEKNAVSLRGKKIAINKASLYAAHFFGAGTAAKVIAADVDARADEIAGEAATKANPSILKGKTVGQFLTWLHGKTGEWAR